MGLYEFQPDDILVNRVKTYPNTNIKIYLSASYLNTHDQVSANTNTPRGHKNLYELNVNRTSTAAGEGVAASLLKDGAPVLDLEDAIGSGWSQIGQSGASEQFKIRIPAPATTDNRTREYIIVFKALALDGSEAIPLMVPGAHITQAITVRTNGSAADAASRLVEAINDSTNGPTYSSNKGTNYDFPSIVDWSPNGPENYIDLGNQVIASVDSADNTKVHLTLKKKGENGNQAYIEPYIAGQPYNLFGPGATVASHWHKKFYFTGGKQGRIYQFVEKNGANAGLGKNYTEGTYLITSSFEDYEYGEKIINDLPMTSSISIDFYRATPHVAQKWHLAPPTAVGDSSVPIKQKLVLRGRKKLYALMNTLNHYTYLSPEFKPSPDAYNPNIRDLRKVECSMINIPSIFYGESIRKGSVKLKYYVTGTLTGEIQDVAKNGELVHTGPAHLAGTAISGSTVGLVLYEEGIILLTSSNDIINHNHKEEFHRADDLLGDGGSLQKPKWYHFGSTIVSGFYDATGSAYTPQDNTVSSSWELDFDGVHHIPTLTMMAHAPRGEINHSNNPTYLNYTNTGSFYSSSAGYIEPTEEYIYNFVSSSYPGYSASFEKQVYISKIGIYDKSKNLIAVAKLANPVRKEEKDSLTFKLKIDL